MHTNGIDLTSLRRSGTEMAHLVTKVAKSIDGTVTARPLLAAGGALVGGLILGFLVAATVYRTRST